MTQLIVNPYRISAPAGSYDSDAQNYINRVEVADGAALETVVKDAMNQLVVTLKTSSLWSPLVYALPGAGPRTLAGGLVPLQNTTESGFFGTVTWDRKTGFNCGADITAVTYPTTLTESNVGTQNDFSMSAWVTQASSAAAFYFGANNDEFRRANTANATFRSRSGTANSIGNGSDVTGFRGVSRSSSASYSRRINGSTASITQTSTAPGTAAFRYFRSSAGRTPVQSSVSTKIAWSHIGSALALDTLEAAVTAYRNTINAAI